MVKHGRSGDTARSFLTAATFSAVLTREQSSLQSFYNAIYNALIDNKCFNNEIDSTFLEISDPDFL